MLILAYLKPLKKDGGHIKIDMLRKMIKNMIRLYIELLENTDLKILNLRY